MPLAQPFQFGSMVAAEKHEIKKKLSQKELNFFSSQTYPTFFLVFSDSWLTERSFAQAESHANLGYSQEKWCCSTITEK